MSSTMKAVLLPKYGSPEVLQLTNVAKPAPADNEILVKIYASTVERTDAIFRGGTDRMARTFTGILKPKFTIPGGEYAGVVEAIGKDVTRFNVGDRVFGASFDFGAHAEYIAVTEDSPMSLIPERLTYDQILSITPGASTALPNLREAANVQPGQKVLINGASGSIGVHAIQLAKHFGAEVTAVTSTGNVELVKSLGADHVIDYKKEDFTQNTNAYDVIFDTVGKSSFGKSKSALKEGGIYLTTVITAGILSQMLVTSKFGNKRAQIVFAGMRSAEEKNQDFALFAQLAAAGTLKPVTDRCYGLDEIAEAHAYVDTGRKKGSVVIMVANDR